MAPFDKETAFAGVIWIDENGKYTYECRFCEFQSIFPRSIEMHISRYHEKELRPKQPVSDENQPLLPRKSDENDNNQFVPSEDVYCVPLPSKSQSHSKSHTKISTKSSDDSRSRRRSKPIEPHSLPKRMKLLDGTSARAAVESQKRKQFVSSNEQSHTNGNYHRQTPSSKSAATSSSRPSEAVPDRVYFGGRQSAPAKKPSPNNQTRRIDKVPIHSVNKCLKCSQQFHSENSLELHAQHCHQLVCTYCQTERPKPFKTEQGFWRHQRIQHAVIFKFRCRICIRAFKHREELEQHFIDGAHDNRIKTVICGYCTRLFESVFQRNEHIKANHKNCLWKKPIEWK